MKQYRFPVNAAAIAKMAKAAYDEEYYQDCFTFKMFTLGDYDHGLSLRDQKIATSTFGNGDIAPIYLDRWASDQPVGTTNHALVNLRYNVQKLVFPDPKFIFNFEEPAISAVCDAWLKKMWSIGQWDDVLQMVATSCQQTGIGITKIGMSGDRPHIEYVDIHNCIWDCDTNNPSEYKWFLTRSFLTVGEAVEKYGHLYNDPTKDPQENGKHIIESIEGMMTSLADISAQPHNAEQSSYLIEWEYNSKTHHCIILGHIESGKLLNWDSEEGNYKWASEYGELGDKYCLAGAQPFGVCPIEVYFEFIVPGRRRPIGVAESTIPVASSANRQEIAMDACVKNAPPINIVSVEQMTPETKAKLEELVKMGVTDPNRIMEMSYFNIEDVSKVFQRVPGGGIDQSMLLLRQAMQREITAVTGVTDASRGNTLQGDRVTAKEVGYIQDETEVSPSWSRSKYSGFLERLAKKVMKIGSRFSRWEGVLQYEHNGQTNTMDTSRYPVNIFLSLDCEISVEPESMSSSSKRAKKEERLQQYMAVDKDAIALKIVDPVAIYKDIYEALGRTDTEKFFATQQPPMPMEAQPGTEAELPPMQTAQ
jgi:hypothetical protein